MKSIVKHWIWKSYDLNSQTPKQVDFTRFFPTSVYCQQVEHLSSLGTGFLPARPVLSQHEVVFLILEQLHWEEGSYWLLMPRKTSKKKKKDDDCNWIPDIFQKDKSIPDGTANRHRITVTSFNLSLKSWIQPLAVYQQLPWNHFHSKDLVWWQWTLTSTLFLNSM